MSVDGLRYFYQSEMPDIFRFALKYGVPAITQSITQANALIAFCHITYSHKNRCQQAVLEYGNCLHIVYL